MSLRISAIAILFLTTSVSVRADDVLMMPLPPAVTSPSPTAVTATGSTPSTGVLPSIDLFQQGMESLDRYASNRDVTRNHSLPVTGTVGLNAGYRRPGASYWSYEGPWGWGGGWWGGPVLITSVCCGPCRPGRGWGAARATGIAVGF